MFEQVVASLEAQPPERREREQRKDPRVGVSAYVTLVPFTDALSDGPLRVRVRDLSAGGIAFFHSRKVDLDEHFVVLLPHGGTMLPVMCAVAYWQPLGERAFAVGARFVQVLQPGAGNVPPSSVPLRSKGDGVPVRRAS
jgi:hypothetical protein